MSGGPNIRAVGPEAASEAHEQDAIESVLPDEPLSLDDSMSVPDEEVQMPSFTRYAWVVPTLACLSIIAWTGFYGWALQDSFAASGTTSQQWVQWIVNWSIPVLLVGVAWLLAMRNSSREANRFAATAAELSRQSSQLETRLGTVNRELSLAREFLGSQSRELESLGRVASERLSTHAEQLQQLIRDNGAQVEAIGGTSETALANMNRLRDDLPVIATSARDVANQVGNAGRTAHAQLDKLVAGFERLNEFGEASDRQVQALSSQIDTTLSGFETQLASIEDAASARFAALEEKSESYRTELDSREVNALAAMRQRADSLRIELSELESEFSEQEEQALVALKTRLAVMRGEGTTLALAIRKSEESAAEALSGSIQRLHDDLAQVIGTLESLDRKAMESSQERVHKLHEEAGRFDEKLAERNRTFAEELSKRQDDFETREAQAAELLAQRLNELDEALSERRESQLAEAQQLVEHGEAIGSRIEELNTLFGSVSETGNEARTTLENGLGSISQQLGNTRSELSEAQERLGELTESGVRLLEIIQSGARHSREDLAQAIAEASEELTAVGERTESLSSDVSRTADHGAALSGHLDKTRADIAEADASMNELQANLLSHAEDAMARLQGLRGGLARLSDETNQLSGDTQDRLLEAISSLEAATKSAFATLDEGAQERISAMGDKLGENAIQALERSLRTESSEAVGRIEQAAAHASGVGREAAMQLRDQLAKVNELTGNLEQRVSRAREIAEEQVNNDFARRMALITESLNSSAIDITGALSTDVTDTAWDAYLKGDRGIFTRRAVRLIDNGEARNIGDLYEHDDKFRDNVNRYIHDFEAMLRTMLSTRDGNALGVTVLGSDVGKLYVVLAQAIERFRN
ncbi:MAG: ATPase [Pseudomonadota bacterium]